MPRIIKAILDNVPDNIIENNQSVKYYINSGKPYLKDLARYYDYGHLEWITRGGDNTDYLKPLRKELYKHKYCDNKSDWNQEMGNTHKIYMISKNWFFYKRKFMSLRFLKLKDKRLFVNNKPREINKIINSCYVNKENVIIN